MVENKRYAIYPIQHQGIWDKFKDAEAQVWKSSIADFKDDNIESLDKSQFEYLKMLLLFFANSDSVVADNIVLNFLTSDLTPEEANFYYGFQLHIENVHNECYSLLIENYIKDLEERAKAFEAIKNFPVVAKKMKWAIDWITNGSYEEKLIAFVCVELILFSSTFAGIFGFKELKKPLNALYVYNSEISRDEASHGEFGLFMYNNYFKGSVSDEKLRRIVLEAYEIEKVFIDDSFGTGVTGFSKEKMLEYIKFVTDNVLLRFGLKEEFRITKCPLKYMENIGISARENFFETRANEYTKMKGGKLEISDDF